jgi:hypothetical protein
MYRKSFIGAFTTGVSVKIKRLLAARTAGKRINPRAKVAINVGEDHAFDARRSRLKSPDVVKGASPLLATSRARGICVT